jgi:Icc-related predicted phosphoesterase
VLVLGGDMTGKALVPILALPEGGFKATLLQQEFFLADEDAVADMERRVKSRGYYPFRVTQEELAAFEADPAKVDAFFHQQMLDVVAQWMALADERLSGSNLRCFVCPGNDDSLDVDDVVLQSKCVELAEGRVVALGDGFQMISTGWSNVTPWQTYREANEVDLGVKIEQMVASLGAKPEMKHTIFNFHCPPYGSNLDEAPEIDDDLNVREAGRSLVPVGSTAVRDAILRHQPLLSLHGHIHEGKGTARLGKTLAINAGSLYEQGVLQGALVDLDRRRGLRSYLLTTG